jgi:hypothetical protein
MFTLVKDKRGNLLLLEGSVRGLLALAVITEGNLFGVLGGTSNRRRHC